MCKYWLKDENFKKLCDMVAKNNMVCFTGSGVSTNLILKTGKHSPNWRSLLQNLKDTLKAQLSVEEKQDLDELLSDNPTGELLVEAASILYQKDKDLFLKELKDSVDLRDGETSLTHRRILKMYPRGIVTYNYDNAHENAADEMNKNKEINYSLETILPSDEDKIINLLKNNLNTPFLLKAHGTVDDIETMVLTGEAYRSLFNQNPYYKAFIQHIFTNFQLLIIGFGLSDPDFDLLLQNVFSTFGSPIQEHIVIKKDKSPKDTLLKLRYGLNFLYIKDFKHIPEILNDAITHKGNILTQIFNDCLSSDLKTRSKAHKDIRNLSDIGKHCLAKIMEDKIIDNLKHESSTMYKNNTENSELVYSYGIIAGITKNAEYTNFLSKVVTDSKYSEPVAHALVHLRDLLTECDLNMVEKWMQKFKNYRFKTDMQNPDVDNRVHKYCESIYYLIKAKYNIIN